MQAVGLHHPNIARTTRWIRDGGYLYMVREWVPGDNLRTRLKAAPDRGFTHLRGLLDPVLDALAFAHDAGFSHGSVVPENIVVSERRPVVTDFGPYPVRNGARSRYLAPGLVASGAPTPRGDYYALCELYKEFLPERPQGDIAGNDARARLMRNLAEAQRTTASVDELRFKLDAINKMADLLGFAGGPEASKVGPRLVCQVTPSTLLVSPGSGATVTLTLWNEGDVPLKVESMVSDRVWLNFTARPPIAIEPDGERDLIVTVSAARLQPGTQSAHIAIKWAVDLPASRTGERYEQEQVVTIPVLVTGLPEPPPIRPALIERLPYPAPAPADPVAPQAPRRDAAPPTPLPPAQATPAGAPAAAAATISCFQEPDPAVAFHGERGVLHIGIRNVGPRRIRIDRIATWPRWLVYPGEFQPIWIEPDAIQYLGLSVEAGTLPGGDYNATVRFTTTVEDSGAMAAHTIWGEATCDARVRIVRRDGPAAIGNSGCATTILGVALLLATAAASLAGKP
jgi:hypothetical protein